MRISERWLREWINLKHDVRHIAEQLTLAGVEVESVNPIRADFESVVVAKVVEISPHPNADKLKVCHVNGGKNKLQVVCGAPNVHIGMRAALALPGAKLPNGLEVRTVTLRGIESSGMLCSAKELGLSEDASGLMALPSDAPVGKSLASYLDLPDTVLDIKLTPNRGDCLSVAGLARELAAIYCTRLKFPRIASIRARSKHQLPITLKAKSGCPIYLGQVINGLRIGALSPVWLTEKLRRSGLRSVNPVVDVTNYVMLELGQPLHAFDLRRLQGGIVVRWAGEGESLRLLDGQTVSLSKDVLVIADHEKAQALAGVMGGMDSAVADDSVDIFIESAFFTPQVIAGKARRYGLVSEAAHRFERGVDPTLPRRALERVTGLLLEIGGGVPGPVIEARATKQMPKLRPVILRRHRLVGILGVSIPNREIESILKRLGMRLKTSKNGWHVTPPSYRFDIRQEEDLIEEVGRIHGFEKIPAASLVAAIEPGEADEHHVAGGELRQCLLQRGYTEAITYSFVSPILDDIFTGAGTALDVENPISNDMSRLRRSLWPGLIQALLYNLNRQQDRVRLFEYGRRYSMQGDNIKEENMISGLAYGPVDPEQWGIPRRPVAFEDVKADVEALYYMGNNIPDYVAESHPALHPGKTAAVYLGKQRIGWIGELHPQLVSKFDLPKPAILFELAFQAVSGARLASFEPVARFPTVRRDIAVVVPENVSAAALQACVNGISQDLIKDVRIFDIYRGRGIDSGRKSIALGLILQDSSRTLTDEAADAIMSQIIQRLQRKLGATIRD